MSAEHNGGAEVQPDDAPQPGGHALPDGAPPHPLIDLARDPNPGKADHARSSEDDE